MKIHPYTVFIVSISIVVSPAVAEGSDIDKDDQSYEKLSPLETVNLTDNQNDSVYPQISSSSNNLFVVWEESVNGSAESNYDIYFKRSKDGGDSFESPINLSNNLGFLYHPQISSVGSNVYVIWGDNSSGKTEIMFSRSSDNGTSFTNGTVVSQDSTDPYNFELAADRQNVYIVWNDLDIEMTNYILLMESNDSGITFGELKKIGKVDNETFPKIATYGDKYYLSWNIKDNNNNQTDILFVKDHENNGRTTPTDKFRRLNSDFVDGGESQVAATSGKVLVSWTNNLPPDKKFVYFIVDSKNGNNFGKTVRLDSSSNNSSNVETIIFKDNAFFVWEDSKRSNEDIFFQQINMNGESKDEAINLSNNPGISECPSITTSENKIHIVWEDYTSGKKCS